MGNWPRNSTSRRSYYYTAVQGDQTNLETVRDALWNLGFHPSVFRKARGQKSKGVDITLTKDVLSHAFLDNYDMAVLVAGDGDYVPLIEEIKRLGKLSYVAFFQKGLSEELRRASDGFLDLERWFLEDWRETLGIKR